MCARLSQWVFSKVQTINFLNTFPRNKSYSVYNYIWMCGKVLRKYIIWTLREPIEKVVHTCSEASSADRYLSLRTRVSYNQANVSQRRKSTVTILIEY